MKTFEDIHARVWTLSTSPADEVAAAARTLVPGDARVVVATCTRVEHYRIDDPREADGVAGGAELRGRDALEHLARVVAGADSLVVGETDVLAQVRTAFADATGVLRAFGDAAVAAGREARLRAGVEPRNAGVQLDLALRLAGAPPLRRACIVGAGAMAGHLARRAAALGIDEVYFASRHHSHATAAAASAGAGAVTLSDLPRVAAGACLVLAFKGDAPRTMRAAIIEAARSSRLTVDLTMPRFAWPSGLAASVMDLSDLARADVLSAEERDMQARLADAAMSAARRQWDHHHGDGAAAARELYRWVERVREAEVGRAGSLDGEERVRLDTVTRALLKRLFHTYGKALRAGGDALLVDATRRLFLNDEAIRHSRTDHSSARKETVGDTENSSYAPARTCTRMTVTSRGTRLGGRPER